MTSTQTISMGEIHRQASRSITLRGSPIHSTKMGDYMSVNGTTPEELRRPISLQKDGQHPSTQFVYSWLDDCFVAQSFLQNISEAQKIHTLDAAITPSRDPFSSIEGHRQQMKDSSQNPATRPTLEERFAALRRTVDHDLVSVTLTSHKFDAQAEAQPATDFQELRDSDATEQESSSPEVLSVIPRTVEKRFGIRTPFSTESYLNELLRSADGTTRSPDPNEDVVVFSVLDEDMEPLPNFSWTSVAPSNSIAAGSLQKGDIRRHAAAKLNTESRSLGLWYEKWPSSGDVSPTLEETHQNSSKIGVSIILDPYIRLVFDGEVYPLDYSDREYQKVDLTIGMIRKDVKALLDVSSKHELRLVVGGRELVDDRLQLRAAVNLEKKVCQGFLPLHVFATVRVTYKSCVVCGDDVEIHKFNHRPFTSACSHEPNTCKPCLRRWIDVALTDKGYDKISCPECSAPFQHTDIKACATALQFEQYDRLATRAALSSIENFRWCLSSRCKSGQIHHDDSPIFVCTACGFKHCIRHNIPWHEGETCQEYNYRVSGRKSQDEDELSRRTIEKISKKCPGRGCGASIEKNKGCDHMTCRKCKHEFCWVCLAEYGPIRTHGNAMHKTSCRYYSNWGSAGEAPIIIA